MKLRNFVFVLCFIFTVINASADKPGRAFRADELVDGQPITAVLDLDGGMGIPSDSFIFKVPKSAYAVRISVEGADADLDLFVNPGSEIFDYSKAVFRSEEGKFNENIFISRQSDTPLESGLYYVDVAYQYDSLPVKDYQKIRSVEYTITMDIISAEPEVVLRPSVPREITLKPENGMFSVASVDIPKGTETFRIDVYNTNADIDLYASIKAPAKCRKEAMYTAESLLGRESLVIGSYSNHSLISGKYYISLMDQMAMKLPQKLSIIVTLDEEPPAFLRELPSLSYPEDSFESAVMSTVEIISSVTKGSGCIVSRSGLVLTNWHVIEDANGKPSERITAAVSLSEYHPPRELFSAEIIAWDESRDLALLQITGGLYGDSLPYGYNFPYLPIGDSSKLRIGQPIGIIGYPEVGGSGSRTSITFTNGVVSGFENAGSYDLIKTDALINIGNSGGAVVNAYHELMGIPGFVMDIGNNKMGYIYPASSIPSEWRDRINKDNE